MKLNIRYIAIILGLPLLLNFVSIDTQAKNAQCKCVLIPPRLSVNDANNVDIVIPTANIFVRTEGERKKGKPTIVFIHGWQENLTIWNCAQGALSKNYYTVAFDLRGYGKSSKTRSTNNPGPLAGVDINYTLEVFTGDLHALLKELCIEDNVILVGHELGASIAISYTGRHKGVKKLVSVSGAPLLAACESFSFYPTPACIVQSECGNCVTPACCEEPPFPLPCVKDPLCCIYPNSVNHLLANITTVVDCATNPDVVDPIEGNIDCIIAKYVKPFVLNEKCSGSDLLTLQRSYANFLKVQNAIDSGATGTINGIILNTLLFALAEDIRLLLPYINVPTLLCAGTIDQLVNPLNSLYMQQRIPGSVLAKFEGKGYFLNLTDVKNFDKLLSKFVKGKKLSKTLCIGSDGCCDVCTSAFVNPSFIECNGGSSALCPSPAILSSVNAAREEAIVAIRQGKGFEALKKALNSKKGKGPRAKIAALNK